MKIFYSDIRTDEHVPADSPKDVDITEALALFDNLSDAEGCFFGVLDAEERTLQFMYNKDGSLYIDMPLPARSGSACKDGASFEECRKMIIDFSLGLAPDSIPGLSFEPW
jgi:hypothetical protein